MKHLIFYIIPILFLISPAHSQDFFSLIDTALVSEAYLNGTVDAEIEELFNSYKDEIEKIEVFEKTAAVFDIDETVLSNFNYYRTHGYSWTDESWNEWTLKEGPRAIPPSLNFYNYLVSRGIKIIFLTGRSDDEFDRTLKNLYDQGYSTFDTLILKPADLSHLTAQEFKTKVREELTISGYSIILNAGDQYSDILGPNSGIRIKLPNYMYYIR